MFCKFIGGKTAHRRCLVCCMCCFIPYYRYIISQQHIAISHNPAYKDINKVNTNNY